MKNRPVQFSKFDGDTGNYTIFSNEIKKIAAKNKVDLILYTFSCHLKHTISKSKGWRNLASTEGPARYSACSEIHIQIWGNNGSLLYECINNSKVERPFLYSVFKKKKRNKDTSFSLYSNHIFSPPLLRSIVKTVSKSFVTINKI